MRNPTMSMAGHLQWTRSGTVWSTWAITPQAYGQRPIKEKAVVRDLHQMLLRSLGGEALMLGVAIGLDPTAIVERQIHGLDLQQCPQVVHEANANLDRLDEMVLGERAYYLAVPMPNLGAARVRAVAGAALGAVTDSFGLPRPRPSDAEITRRLAQAERIESLIPVPFKARRVGEIEQLWLAEHCCRRGMLDMPPPAGDGIEAELALTSGIRMPEPVLDEGAWSDEDAPRVRNPLTRRVLKVTDPRAAELGQGASYQCPMVMTDTPQGGIGWPGSELLDSLDNLTQDADWAIRLRITGRDDVMRANRKAIRELNDQMDQRSDELTAGVTELDLAADLLGEYQSIYAGDRLEVEVEHTVIVTIGGASVSEVDEQARSLTAALGSSDFKFERPLGGLQTLWWATQVGVPTSSAIRSWAGFTSAGKLALMVPYISTDLGGRRGPVWGLNRSTARTGVIHLDPGGYPELDKSGSVCFVGELGAGKSAAMKSMANAIIDEGGQILAIDKSADGEWAYFAQALTAATVVDPEDLRWSMDPLRVLGLQDGSPVLESFLTQLLDTSPQETPGVTLARALDPQYMRQHDIAGAEDLMNHLLTGCELEGAPELGVRISNHASKKLGRLVFDQSLPPVRGTESAIVWRTHTMRQPTERELTQRHLFRGLAPDKIFGRAYYSLLTATARRFAFADRSRVSALVCDEAYDIFGNPENALELEHFGRQGRRPKALLLVASHNPDRDFGDETLRKLIPTRIVLRQTDPDLARGAVRFLGIDEDDPAFADMVDELVHDTAPVLPDVGVLPERRGEGFLRDAFGRVGRAKVLLPAVPERAKAATSTPPKRSVSV